MSRDGKQERLVIQPDAFFCIQDEGEKHFFFLEADRSTTTHRRFVGKMKAYAEWRERGGCEKKHGVQSFRVLTVTEYTTRPKASWERAHNLALAVKEAGVRRLGAFWFTSATELSLTEPEKIFGPIWITAKDGDEGHFYRLVR